jgi:hypothetical protein
MVKILTSCFLLLSIFVVIYFPTVIFKYWRERERERKEKTCRHRVIYSALKELGDFRWWWWWAVAGGGVAPF